MKRYGRYRIAYADPPWVYRSKHGKRGAAAQYRVTPTAVLARLDVGSIMARDAALLMWAPGPQHLEVAPLMAAWGFRYSTIALDWVKTRGTAGTERRVVKLLLERFGGEDVAEDRRNAQAIAAELAAEGLLMPTLHWGMGASTRSGTEQLYLGLRGRLQRESAGVHQVLLSPLPMAGGRILHSQKPAEARERIVALLGDRPRIELFARHRVPGWDAWGDGVPGGSDVEIPLLPDPSQNERGDAAADPAQTTIFDLLEAAS